MIRVFKSDEKEFKSNGVQIIDKYIVVPVISEELNGIFSFEFSIPISRSQHIEKENIVVAPTPTLGDQAFRISQIRKSNGMYHVTCYHIFYDLTHNIIEDINIMSAGASEALDRINAGCANKHPFKFYTDMSDKISNCRIVRYNPVKALLGNEDNTFINRWGGEIERDNFRITMKKRLGIDSGTQIRYRKNLTGYEAEIDFTQITTRIMPKGFDGVLLPEKYVDSPNINKYHNIKTKVIEYSDVKIKDENSSDSDGVSKEEAYKELRKLAKLEFSENHIDEPRANYKVNFVALENTKEYKKIKRLESVNLGDRLKVVHKNENLDISARVISYKYNPISKSYIEVEMGNIADKFTSLSQEIKRIGDKVDNEVQSALNKSKTLATKILKEGFGGHVKILPDKILIMDTDDEKTAKKVWMWNKNGLGFSNTGINGEFGLAMTLDGAIVADYITTGNLNANLLTAGHIKGKNFDLDLDAGVMKFGNGAISKNNLAPDLVQELKGQDGQSQYVHTRYSDSPGTTGAMYVEPSSNSGEPHKYIGFAVTNSKGAPALKSEYKWSKYVGDDGSNGTPGRPGTDGKTPYFHVAWADNSSGSSGFTTSGGTDKLYMGTYTDFTESDSIDPGRYKWVKVKGDDGESFKYNLISNGDFHIDFTKDEPGHNSKVLNRWQAKSRSDVEKMYIRKPSDRNWIALEVSATGTIEINQYLNLKKNTKYYIKATIASERMVLYYHGSSYNTIAIVKDNYEHFTTINTSFTTEDSDTHYIQLDCKKRTRVRDVIISEEPIPDNTEWYPSKFDGIGQDGKPGRDGRDGERGAQGPPGRDGRDGSMVDLPPALKDWSGKATEISGKYVFTPELFVGTNGDSKYSRTGIYMGSGIKARDLFDNFTTFDGITGINNGTATWHLSVNGNGWIGNSQRAMWWNKDGELTLPKVKAREIEAGAITTDILYPGLNNRIVLESGYKPGDNDCISIDTNTDSSGEKSLRLKVNAGTYLRLSKDSAFSFISRGSNVLHFDPRQQYDLEFFGERGRGTGKFNMYDAYVEAKCYEGQVAKMGIVTYEMQWSTSDKRLKTDIEYLSESMISNLTEFIKKLNIAEFYFKSDEKKEHKQISVIAQDVIKEFPDLKNYIVNEVGEYYTVNSNNINFATIVTLQEEIKKREELESKVNKLENEMAELKALLKKEGEVNA
ncbi:phage tail spike protein [Peptostreptococcus anaerobius]